MIKNEKLLDAVTYQDENGTWYIGLKYGYEDKSGIHERYYPKVEFPFFCGKLPSEDFRSDRFGRDERTISLFTNKVTVFRGNFWNHHSGQLMRDVCVVDDLVKPAVHEMTIEEIEKELGYKVKIINKENGNES